PTRPANHTRPRGHLPCRAHSLRLLLILVLFLPGMVVGVAAKPRPVQTPAEERHAAPGPELELRFDYDVIDQILKFAGRGIASRDELERWVRLPGNLELLRQGRIERDLTPDLLKEAARVIVGGGTFPGPGTLGTLSGSDWGAVRQTLAAVRAREDD